MLPWKIMYPKACWKKKLVSTVNIEADIAASPDDLPESLTTDYVGGRQRPVPIG